MEKDMKCECSSMLQILTEEICWRNIFCKHEVQVSSYIRFNSIKGNSKAFYDFETVDNLCISTHVLFSIGAGQVVDKVDVQKLRRKSEDAIEGTFVLFSPKKGEKQKSICQNSETSNELHDKCRRFVSNQHARS